MAEGKKLAERIRSFRERLNMSVDDLAAKSGVSAGVIASVETSEVYPSLGVLVKLSRALGQRLGTFMDDQYRPDPLITRASERTEDDTLSHKSEASNGFRYFPLGMGKTDRAMEPFYIEIAGDAKAGLSSHEGEEFIIVISGEIELTYGGKSQLLKPGDSAYYNSVVQHIVKAAGGKPASIYAVIMMPA